MDTPTELPRIETTGASLVIKYRLDGTHQGESIPASNAHYREYLERAEGLPVTQVAEPYWD